MPLSPDLLLPMPQLTIPNVGTFEVTPGRRLVTALTDVAGVDQLHACGGVGKCTTCRVRIVAGEPAKMTQAERDALAAKSVTEAGVRLSCQIACDQDMTVEVISRFEGSGRKDSGKRPSEQIEPPPSWL
jgi:ferredoxin